MNRHIICIIAAFAIGTTAIIARPPHPAPASRAACVLEPQAFDRLVAMVNNRPFDDEKFLIIEAAALGGHFTCGQASALMSAFKWDNEKLRVLRYIAPRIVDLCNSDTIFNQFTFDSDKKEAWKILTGTSGNGK